MISFKQYITEEPSMIPGDATKNAQPSPFIPIPKDATHMGSLKVGEETFHFYRSPMKDSAYYEGNHEGFITKEVGDAQHVVGDVGFILNNGENKYITSGPRLAIQHRKDRKSTRLNSSHVSESRMPSSA